MADELSKRDQNSNASLLGLTNDANREIRNLLVDPTSRGLLVHIAGGSAGGDGTIIDGVDANIKATVKDYTNSNPLAVAVMDANGDIITSFGTPGGATAAKQDTIIGHLDGVEGLLTTIDANIALMTPDLEEIRADADSIRIATELIDDTVKTDDAGFTVATDKVLMGGRLAVAVGSDPDAADAADAGVPIMTRHRTPFYLGGHPNTVTLEAAYTAAQTDAAIITISTGQKIVITQIHVTADNANTVDVGFRIGFGTASTPTTTGVVVSHPGLAAGSGVVIGDGSGIIGIGADNADLRITSEVPTTGSLRVVVKYHILPS